MGFAGSMLFSAAFGLQGILYWLTVGANLWMREVEDAFASVKGQSYENLNQRLRQEVLLTAALIYKFLDEAVKAAKGQTPGRDGTVVTNAEREEYPNL